MDVNVFFMEPSMPKTVYIPKTTLMWNTMVWKWVENWKKAAKERVKSCEKYIYKVPKNE